MFFIAGGYDRFYAEFPELCVKTKSLPSFTSQSSLDSTCSSCGTPHPDQVGQRLFTFTLHKTGFRPFADMSLALPLSSSGWDVWRLTNIAPFLSWSTSVRNIDHFLPARAEALSSSDITASGSIMCPVIDHRDGLGNHTNDLDSAIRSI